jgi:hypothetical protein
LAAKGLDAAVRMKSSDYGVFRRGPNGHQDTSEET